VAEVEVLRPRCTTAGKSKQESDMFDQDGIHTLSMRLLKYR